MGRKVTIIGAGNVGAAIAYTLSQDDLATEIVLIDVNQNKARGEVMVIVQGTSFRDPISVIAGGIDLAPLRSVINYVLDNRDNYGTIDILYGSRSADDLVQRKEIEKVWSKVPGVNIYLTIDREQEGWDGHVGFVPNHLKEIGFTTDKTAIL